MVRGLDTHRNHCIALRQLKVSLRCPFGSECITEVAAGTREEGFSPEVRQRDSSLLISSFLPVTKVVFVSQFLIQVVFNSQKPTWEFVKQACGLICNAYTCDIVLKHLHWERREKTLHYCCLWKGTLSM